MEAWRVDLRSDQPVSIDETRVFVAAGEALIALNAADRTVLWRSPAGTVTAPILAQGGWIIAASTGQLAAYRAADGTEVWRQASGTERERPTIEGDCLYVPLEDGRLLALDLETGRKRWEQRFDGAPTEVLAFPDRVYLGSADKYFYALRADTGEMSWRSRVGAVLRGRPVAEGGRVYVAAIDNVLRGFDRRTGALVLHPSVPYRPISGPVILGTSVLVPGAAPELRAFDAATGRPAGEIKLAEPLAGAPSFGQWEGATVMAVFTGALSNQWMLSLLGPPPAATPGTGAPAGLQPRATR